MIRRWLPHPLLSALLMLIWLLLNQSLAPGTIVLGALLGVALGRVFGRLRPPRARVRRYPLLAALLLAGADKVSINTAAVTRPEFVKEAAEKFGSQCIVAAIDAKGVGGGKYEVFTHGGRQATGIDAVAHAKKLVGFGAGEILLTSMDRDGVKSGYDLDLTRAVSDAVTVPVIASGGVGNVQDLVDGVIKGHASAVLAASIFHFGGVSIAQAKQALSGAGLPVRPI